MGMEWLSNVIVKRAIEAGLVPVIINDEKKEYVGEKK